MKNVWILDDNYLDGIKVFSNPRKLYVFLTEEKLINITYKTFLKKLSKGSWSSSNRDERASFAYKKEVL